MFNSTLFRTAISIGCLLMMSVIASADTKIKSRQTSGGQTYENTSYIKGKRQRSETNNGQMINITQCDLRRNIQIMPAAKVYMIQPYDEPGAAANGNPGVVPPAQQNAATKKGGVVTSIVTTKDTGERKQMFGYTARHIITTMEMKSSPDACSTADMKMEIDGWYIDAAFALDCDSARAYVPRRPTHASGGCRDRYETKQIGIAKKGFPVWEKMTMNGGYSSITEVIEFSQATLDASLFDVPEGYREVDDFASAFSAAAMGAAGVNNPSTSDSSAPSAPTAPTAPTAPSSVPASAPLGPKRAGVVRLGVASVKTGNVAEGMNAAELAAAVRNTLLQTLKSTNVEIVPIDASGAAIQEEARQKECDYVVYSNVSHKKGGGGFGSMIGNTASKIGSSVGYPSSTAAVVATNTIAAATVAQNIKAKDELTLDIRLERPGSTTPSFAQTYKGKAKSGGEDIITPLVQQASQAITQSISH